MFMIILLFSYFNNSNTKQLYEKTACSNGEKKNFTIKLQGNSKVAKCVCVCPIKQIGTGCEHAYLIRLPTTSIHPFPFSQLIFHSPLWIFLYLSDSFLSLLSVSPNSIFYMQFYLLYQTFFPLGNDVGLKTRRLLIMHLWVCIIFNPPSFLTAL